MFLLNGGRAPLLDFLRNLTPQAVLLSFVFVAGSRLDFGTWDISNAPATLIFYSLLATCVMAAWANCTLFIEKSVVTSERIERGLRLLDRRKPTNLKRSRAASILTWRYKKLFYIELIVLVLILEVGLTIVFVTAISSALAFLKIKF